LVVGGWCLLTVPAQRPTTNPNLFTIHQPNNRPPTYFLGAGGVGVWVGYRERYFASIAERIDVIGAPE
jgi:hypothetical protein